MLEGFAAMGIKYNKGKFEVLLSGVETDDVLDLLSFDAQPVRFKISKASETDDGYREEPDTGRMFTSQGGVVEDVRPVEPARSEEEKPEEEAQESPCDNCAHLIPDESDEEGKSGYTCDAGQSLGRINCPAREEIESMPEETGDAKQIKPDLKESQEKPKKTRRGRKKLKEETELEETNEEMENEPEAEPGPGNPEDSINLDNLPY